MIRKNLELEIPTDDIFRNDVLERKTVIENLSTLVLNTYDPFVLSIQGDWGSGKTTFVKLWKAYLEQTQDLPTIYFSAWEDDFSNEPLFAIMGEINTFLKKLIPEDAKRTDGMKIDKFKETGSKVIRKALPALVKGATAGFLDIDKGFEAALSSISEAAGKELIEHYEKEKAIRDEFRDALSDVLDFLPKGKPLIIFIDELDRCRPLYAIELLERIKHFFGVERVIFVLSVDKEQLSESIKSQYGDIDAENYLRRFIDLQFSLENPNIDTFCDYLDRKYNFDATIRAKEITVDVSKSDMFHHLGMIKVLVKEFGFSLREIEQFFIKLDIVFKTMDQRLFSVHFRLFVIFEILRMREYEMYKGIIKNDLDSKKEAKELFDKKLRKYVKEDYYHRDVLLFATAVVDAAGLTQEQYTQLIKEKEKEQEKISDQQSLEYQRLEFYVTLLKNAPDHFNYTLNQQISTVVKKLEFLDSFKI
jgi:hypothetical protein